MNRTKKLTEMAMMIAFAVICSFIKVWEMPQGGSVALTMVPLLVASFRLGAVCGMITGGVYGVISLLIAGVVYHPASVLLDYILAFALVGTAGFFKGDEKGIIWGSITGVGGRFLSSLVSGGVIFAEYAPPGQNPWIYSLVYQATYMIPELVICIAVLLFLYVKSPDFFKSK